MEAHGPVNHASYNSAAEQAGQRGAAVGRGGGSAEQWETEWTLRVSTKATAVSWNEKKSRTKWITRIALPKTVGRAKQWPINNGRKRTPKHIYLLHLFVSHFIKIWRRCQIWKQWNRGIRMENGSSGALSQESATTVPSGNICDLIPTSAIIKRNRKSKKNTVWTEARGKKG